ncbi:GNAT family N-acetyltransferase [Actinacidiphila acididurans]|uniref:GNAT family N-acetyltransferase n=1 Tax=Actinacidiphila acididurans TaxID=2784346 RepID=A0ABS2TQ53_9ACTN|nr:GNAT family N-acetyltransferase [Actinacidiphila acididurans]MBM9504098.1 GNAT family N-acetyltransferase [Actinacidiphila acididurans]
MEFSGADATRGGARAVPAGTAAQYEVRPAALADPLVRPLLRELEEEYSTRYPGRAGGRAELARYPAEEFEPAHGGLLLMLLRDGEPVAGGAYRRYDEQTAELKRIWTHSAHRRKGLGRRIVSALEQAAAAAGYRRVYLTTGPRQPEAKGLYLAAGYTALFDLSADPETLGGPLPFAKHLVGTSPVRPDEFRPTPRVDFGPAPATDGRPHSS